jgi:hypothetical protein
MFSMNHYSSNDSLRAKRFPLYPRLALAALSTNRLHGMNFVELGVVLSPTIGTICALMPATKAFLGLGEHF